MVSSSSPSSSSSILDSSEAIYRIQLSLLDGINDDDKLFLAGSLLSCSDYEDVVVERTISNLCGYPLCRNSLPKEPLRKGRFRISLKEHRVYDLKETCFYCSSECLIRSRSFAESLKQDRFLVTDQGKIMRVLSAFDENGNVEEEEKGLEGSTLKILDKLDLNKDDDDAGIDFLGEEWMGPSDAIEGYVPQRDRRGGSLLSTGVKVKEESKSSLKVNSKKKRSTSLLNSGKDDVKTAEEFSKNISPRKRSSDEIQILSSKIHSLGLKDHASIAIVKAKAGNASLKSCLKSSSAKNLATTVKWADQKKNSVIHANSARNLYEAEDVSLDMNRLEISCQANDERSTSIMSEDATELEPTMVKADVISEDINNTSKCIDKLDISSVGEVEESSRLVSAEACAQALGEAAETVALGKSDADDALSEAGIVILPPDQCIDDEHLEGADEEAKPSQSDLNKISSSSPLRAFDPNDSWYDSPPEGFSLTLSPFATMCMALFGWITTSSLAFIYGKEESVMEDLMVVNGRQYPRKIDAGDGLSLEIKQTLGGCLSRELPDVVMKVKVATPVSILEQALGRLLHTMSFIDPLPPFRTEQWHVIILLFLEALSVYRLQSLSSYMTKNSHLINKFLDTAQVSRDEYDTMKDHLIPLSQ